MKTINEVQEELVAEFEDFSDWLDRYSLIIEMGNALPGLDDSEKTADNLIDGCQSRVWIASSVTDDGLLHFDADSDAIIVKGMIAMLLRVLSDRTPQEIVDADLWFIEDIGLRENLSPTRSNGLLAMVKRIKGTALAALAVEGPHTTDEN